jgi:hypothetical protein
MIEDFLMNCSESNCLVGYGTNTYLFRFAFANVFFGVSHFIDGRQCCGPVGSLLFRIKAQTFFPGMQVFILPKYGMFKKRTLQPY